MPAQNSHSNVEDWSSFLHRSAPPNPPAWSEKVAACLADKRVLITGAGGSIGSALAQSTAHSDVRELLLLDASESALYEVHQAICELQNPVPLVPLLVSVSDATALSSIFCQYRPEIVFHAAAFKHVPLMEKNPFAAMANNAFGTRLLAETATAYGCEQMLMVSTDKAADPVSMMGASKRIAELILLAPNQSSTRMKVVRLGNVLGTSGSVAPLFTRQIAHGGPVTVTHPDVRRYLMTMSEALNSIFSALCTEDAAGLLVPELATPVRILDLAKFLIGDKDVPIVFTGLRPGDKMEESLTSQRESYRNLSGSTLRTVQSPVPEPEELANGLDDLQSALEQRNLPHLVAAVQHLVPEYQPTTQIRKGAAAVAAVNV